MELSDRLTRAKQQTLAQACEAFEDATQRYTAKPARMPRSRAAIADAAVSFKIAGKRFDMLAVVEPQADRQYTAGMLHRRHAGEGGDPARALLLVTQYVSPKLASELIAGRIPFIDTAGNAYIDEPEATIMIVGRDRPATFVKETSARSTTPKGLRVMFALASEPALVNAPYRTIAAHAGVSLNTVNLAMDDLIARAFVGMKGDERVMADWRRFVEAWVSLYPVRLRPKLGGRRFKAATSGWWRDMPFDHYAMYLGGEAAAERLTGQLKSASVTIYSHSGISSEFLLAARLLPDVHGEVEILDAFWPSATEARGGDGVQLVHPLLIYADLIASGDSRLHSVAETVYEQCLSTPPV
ncbi:type IV toxin-antitoxin system AbiEi family antitoxin [Paraburkholderia sp. J94]|uniref:type IV toxin-antitoxin system AbiEi family antitoxin n=1 Tax=Paraburkholderia sp. J94 TaxID=2805441 RepID=UPI002AAFDD1E|nr:type IV toxin-antitoxin system AbiEi family antitoxin [Paraburkholderia sp. J94]